METLELIVNPYTIVATGELLYAAGRICRGIRKHPSSKLTIIKNDAYRMPQRLILFLGLIGLMHFIGYESGLDKKLELGYYSAGSIGLTRSFLGLNRILGFGAVA